MSMAFPSLRWLAIAGVLSAASVGLAQSLDSDVRLEGSGQHRSDMNNLQLKAFDSAIWSNLSKWSGTAVTPEATKDKAVLIVTWTSYAKSANNAAIVLAQRLSTQYADKGLIVVGIHNPKGFDSAKAIAQELGMTFPYAADEQGKVRAALKVDQDPDFYLVDRAGNMRFADIETASVERAVEITVAEKPEQAAAVPGAVAKSLADKQRETMMSREVKGAVRPGQPLTVPFSPPPDEAYSRASWPAIITKTGAGQFDQLAQQIRKDKPTITLNDEGWATPKPVSTGRILLIYLIDPTDSQVSEIPGKMGRLQDAFARDLVVVGNVFGSTDDGSETEEEKAERQRSRMSDAKEMIRERALNHGFNVYPIKVADRNLNEIEIPIASRRHLSVAFLVGSDGRCRWIGNEYWDGFETVVNEFIEADPGVRARRKAEEAAAKAAGN